MLTKEQVKEIEHELSHYHEPRAACIEALKVVQKHYGWVSDEHLKEVAKIVDLSPTELDGVATFYNLIFRKPVGKHVILMCDSVSCWLTGFDKVKERCREKLGVDLGETTPDKKFTFLTIPCLGTCDRAPAMMIDDDLHQDLRPDKVDQILEKYR